jgi:ABC-type transporter Mla subunit MlaD
LNRDFWAGMFVLLGLLSLAVVYTKLFVEEVTQDVHIYHLDAQNVSGIVEGVPVMMQGFAIGTVSGIEVETKPTLKFDVLLAIRPEIPIPSGSRVVLGTRLAGGAVIDIRPPQEPSFAITTEEHLVLTPVADVQELLETVALVLEDVQVITARGRAFVEDPEQGLELRLKAIDAVIQEVTLLLHESVLLVKKLNGTVETLQPGVHRSIESAEQTLESTGDLIDELDSVVGVVEQRLEEVSKAIDVMELYDPEEGTEMSEMFENLQVTAEEMRGLTEDMNKGIRQTKLGARLLREKQEEGEGEDSESKSLSKEK